MTKTENSFMIKSNGMFEGEDMVRFQRRWASKRYKGRNSRYPIYSVNFPAELNEKLEPKRQKDYHLEWTEQETDKEETITITFTRNKQQPNSKAISNSS